MSEKLLTTAEYAAKRKVSPVAVTRAMKKGKRLIGAVDYEKIGRDWFITVNGDLTKKNIGKCVVIQK